VILADTSVWIDFFYRGDATFDRLLVAEEILLHPVVYGELALGSLEPRASTLRWLRGVPHALAARDEEVFRLIEDSALYGSGIGFTDAHLLASVLLTSELRLWTRDRRLRTVAQQLALDAGLS
jgi:predicted nucleic acid-binding protein